MVSLEFTRTIENRKRLLDVTRVRRRPHAMLGGELIYSIGLRYQTSVLKV